MMDRDVRPRWERRDSRKIVATFNRRCGAPAAGALSLLICAAANVSAQSGEPALIGDRTNL